MRWRRGLRGRGFCRLGVSWGQCGWRQGCEGVVDVCASVSDVSAGDFVDAGAADERARVDCAEVGAGRVAWLRADLDRQYGAFHLPDHGRLLANLTRWACRGGFLWRWRVAGLWIAGCTGRSGGMCCI